MRQRERGRCRIVDRLDEGRVMQENNGEGGNCLLGSQMKAKMARETKAGGVVRHYWEEVAPKGKVEMIP